jgi:hypothetical protein
VLQGAIIAIGMGLRLVPWRRYLERPRPGSGTPAVAVAGEIQPGPRSAGEGGGP